MKANISHGVNFLKSSTPVLKQLVDKKEIKNIRAITTLIMERFYLTDDGMLPLAELHKAINETPGERE